MREMSGSKGAGARAALIVGFVSFVLLGTFLVGGVVGWWPVETDPGTLVLLGTMLLFLALGPLILWKADGNRIGWAFSGIGLSILCSALAGGFGDRGVIVAGAIGGAFWLSWIIAIGTLVLWYPTGRVPSPRWKWLERLGFLLLVITFVTYTFAEQICVESNEGQCLNWVDNPIGIPGMPNPEFGWLSGPLFALYPFFMGAVLVSLFMRLRRARGIERLQLKWFLLACSSVVLALSIEFALEGFGVPEPPLWLDVWIQISFLSIPVAAALAILRYRLYEIDRIISRTVSYALVVGILAVAYLGALTWLTSLLPDQSQLVVAGATLGVAFLFNPLRTRVQAAVDRRFNRSRYDAERVMDRFAGSLRDQVDSDQVMDGWVGVVTETMQPSTVAVWVRGDG